MDILGDDKTPTQSIQEQLLNLMSQKEEQHAEFN